MVKEASSHEAVVVIGFGARLKKAREAAGLSGTELGKGIGESAGKDAKRQSVSDWEKERHYPSARQLYLICLRLGKGADELLFGRKDPFADEKVANAAKAVGQLNEAQRRELLAMLTKPVVPDADVEDRMPVTRRRSKQTN